MSRRRKEKIVSKRAEKKARRRLRSILGPLILSEAEDRFGKRKIDDAARLIASRLDEKQRREIQRERGKRSHLALSEISPRRKEVRSGVNRRQKTDVVFIKRKKGTYTKFLGARRIGTATEKQKRAHERTRPYRKLVRLVSGTLELSASEAKELIKDVKNQSIRALKKFKKTKKYKNMSARKKRRYNLENTTVTAMVRLEFLLTGESDPVMFHFREKND